MSEIQPTYGQLTVIDAEGNEVLCNILFTFRSEEFNKNYVVFYPIESMNNDDEQIELSAASYVENEDGTGTLSQIETDEEWEVIEDAIGQYEESMAEQEAHGCCCGGHDEEHHCCHEGDEEHHCCCEDEDDEEEHHCCCRHNHE